MIHSRLRFVVVLFIICMLATPALAAGETSAEESQSGAEESKPKSARAKMLFGQPVNVNIAGGGSLPKGRALTIINGSFSDKTRAKNGYTGSDVFSQSWLAKFRYGITNHFELSMTLPYINNSRTNPTMSPKHIEGPADLVTQIVFAPWNEHQGNPASVSFTAGILIPTGMYGNNHLPGNGVWGGRLAFGVGKWITPDIKFDTEAIWSAPFGRGNQNVKRGYMYQWNTNLRYVFNFFDIGLESTLTYQDSGTKKTTNPYGNTVSNMNNGFTEWFAGPTMNFAIDPLSMWAGVGVFFPVIQAYKGPAAVEDIRYEFKIGRMW